MYRYGWFLGNRQRVSEDFLSKRVCLGGLQSNKTKRNRGCFMGRQLLKQERSL